MYCPTHMHSAQPDLSSSMLPGRNFVCPNEIVTYSCSGISTLIDWYTPPLLNESDSLRYAVTSIPGTVEPSPEASIRSNLVRGSPNFLTELTVDGSVDTDLSIICRFGNSSAAFVETSLDHNIQSEICFPVLCSIVCMLILLQNESTKGADASVHVLIMTAALN